MTLSTKLRLIILIVGALLLVVIYLLGRRRAGSQEGSPPLGDHVDSERKPTSFDEAPAVEIDEEEFDEPSYLRRGARRERMDTVAIHDDDDDSMPLPSVYVDPPMHEATVRDSTVHTTKENGTQSVATTRVPVMSMHDPDRTMPMKVDAVLPSASNVAVVNQTVTAPPPAKTVEQRQLIALRLAMSEPVSGEQLLSMFKAENLHHGKFNIFHRLHLSETVFSAASMIEPGSFDLAAMSSQSYPGITLFMLLPGPLKPLESFEQMLSCAQRLAQLTSGVVQDESGVLLLESGIERLREKVCNFELS